MIKDIPRFERPREKIKKYGVNSLSNTELLAVILKNGTKGKSVIELSNEILYSLNCLNDLKDLELLELQKIKGIGDVKAMEILCAIELGRRINIESNGKIIFKNARQIFDYVKFKMDFPNERLMALYCDSKCQLICEKILFEGSSRNVFGSPNEIFKYALKIGATSFILVHNHPSGNPSPSKADIKFTDEIRSCAELVNVIFLDHVIIGNTYYSFNENGLI